jgi:hypothetical protein
MGKVVFMVCPNNCKADYRCKGVAELIGDRFACKICGHWMVDELTMRRDETYPFLTELTDPLRLRDD